WSATDNVGVTTVDLLLSRTGPSGPFEVLATGIPNTGSHTWTVAGSGTSSAVFKVCAHDAGGNVGEDMSDSPFTISNTAAVERLGTAPPAAVTLERIQPNPMRDVAGIAFGLPAAAHVRLRVLDLQGRDVADLVDEELPAGGYAMTWDARRGSTALPSGM